MDPINPWIDAAEMRQLAENLIQPGSQTTSPNTDTGFGEKFEGFAQVPATKTNPTASTSQTQEEDPQPLAELTPSNNNDFAPAPTLEAKPAPSTPAAVTTAVTPEPTATTPTTKPAAESATEPIAVYNSDPSLVKSAEELQTKLQQNHQADGIFILNRAGEKLFGRDTHKRFQFIARNLIQLASRKGAPSGNVRIKIGPARILEIISADAAGDGLILGTITPEPLTPEIRKKISQQLENMHISRGRS